MDEFLDLFKQNEVQTLVDVRRWPTSKTQHFKREEMQKWLNEAGIRYLWLGDKLGGYRGGGYKAHLESREFEEGASLLLELCKRSRTCIMCLEISPAGCHRRFISGYISGKGVDVLHIISKLKIRRSALP